MTARPDYHSRVRGALLGGAIGDALGAPVEFMGVDAILAQVGPEGVREYLPAPNSDGSRRGLITDDTQMTLFVVEGLIRARVREDRGIGFTVAVTDHALRRWLDTQEHDAPTGERDGWLQGEQWLYARRAPGSTCLGALRASRTQQLGTAARNDSKGCGGVMRSAPFGLLLGLDVATAHAMACESAGYTHGHPSGQHASGALAVIVQQVVAGASLRDAVEVALGQLRREQDADEVIAAVEAAVGLALSAPADRSALATLGEGWVAEEALAISLYAALSHPGPDDVLDALALAVTHSGDSDSTGAITGNILGALHGDAALPAPLVVDVEGRGTILQLADDLVLEETARDQLHGDHGAHTTWTTRYPGW